MMDDDDDDTYRTPVDWEIAAMGAIVEALASLDDEARNRVLRWACDRFRQEGVAEARIAAALQAADQIDLCVASDAAVSTSELRAALSP